MADIHILGRGTMHFAEFKAGTQTPKGERYLGNTPEFALTISAENLDHFSSDHGIREKDDSVTIETSRSGSLVTDNINPANVALFFFGSHEALAISAATITDEAVTDVEPGLTYQLGTSPTHPSGARGLEEFSVGVDVVVVRGSDTLTAVDDYTIDMDLARLTITDGGDVVTGDDLLVDYKIAAQTRERVISGSQAIEGSLRFIADNPVGADTDYFLPWVKITPNGDYSLKGEAWQQIPLNIEVLKKTGVEAIYADGRAFTG